jgi:hypothetical protein
MQMRGIELYSDLSVAADDFDQARKHAEEIYENFTKRMSEAGKERFARIWPLREGRFDLTAESCVDE